MDADFLIDFIKFLSWLAYAMLAVYSFLPLFVLWRIMIVVSKQADLTRRNTDEMSRLIEYLEATIRHVNK